MFELEFHRDGVSPVRFPLATHRALLGAALSADVTLDGERVEAKHAILTFFENAWRLKPCGSARITLNGAALQEESMLKIGDCFDIGPWHFTFKPSLEEGDLDEACGATKLLENSEKSGAPRPFVLSFTDSDGLAREFKLKDERTVVGKSVRCELVLKDDYISSRHFEICLDAEGALLRDLGSTNGTFVNGLKTSEARLKEGTEIECGKTKFTFGEAAIGGRRKKKAVYPWTVPLLGASPAFEHLAKQIERVAPLAQNVFIHGETGTGKELVAAALHELSSRKARPFIAINCGAISKDLMESELFGHEKGAFTGASNRRVGAFELANGGTLFLDEMGELPLDLQPKLLRVLETGCFRRVGGRDEIKVDVRVFSATHRNLSQAISLGRFREDLYYRLYVLPVEVPSLRERLEDIPMLADFFVGQACPIGREVSVSREVFPVLSTYDWPGNVRELRHLVYRALAFCDGGLLKKEHVLPFLKNVSEGVKMVDDHAPAQQTLPPLKRKEREAIVETLREAGGNQSEAARKLGIGRTTLYYKLKEYAIDMRPRALG